MGIRMALGAAAQDVVGLILRQGARHIGIGLVIGMILAWASSAMLGFIMFQVNPRDLTVYGTVLAVICTVGFFASWIPARRATGVDPVNALRHE
jgi:ABC-type antimicrobial peptide transport system permease subunit